jgi:hypothetical protein
LETYAPNFEQPTPVVVQEFPEHKITS